MTSMPPSGHYPSGADDVFSPAGIVWTPIAPALASLRRVLLLAVFSVVAVVVVASALAFGQPMLLAVLLVPIAAVAFGWLAIGRQVAAYGYAERSEDLLIRKGLMFRSMVVVPYGRMQFVDVQAGPLERFFHLAQVQLHTASAGSDAKIPGVREEEAARLRDRLASRGQARLAGL
jgi:membrane protein YdbS with pleckstrin-like domain